MKQGITNKTERISGRKTRRHNPSGTEKEKRKSHDSWIGYGSPCMIRHCRFILLDQFETTRLFERDIGPRVHQV